MPPLLVSQMTAEQFDAAMKNLLMIDDKTIADRRRRDREELDILFAAPGEAEPDELEDEEIAKNTKDRTAWRKKSKREVTLKPVKVGNADEDSLQHTEHVEPKQLPNFDEAAPAIPDDDSPKQPESNPKKPPAKCKTTKKKQPRREVEPLVEIEDSSSIRPRGAVDDSIKDKYRQKLEELRAARQPTSEKGKKRALSATDIKQRRLAEKDRKKQKRKIQKAKLKLKKQLKAAENKGTDTPKSNLDIEEVIPTSNIKMRPAKDDIIKSGKKKKRMKPTDRLKVLEARQEKMEKVQETKGVEAAMDFKKRQLEKTAEARASGVKVKDDPTRLKKSIKRKENLKERSRKKWRERKEAVESKMLARQEKRKSNIQARRQDKLDRKEKRLRKKGRIFNLPS